MDKLDLEVLQRLPLAEAVLTVLRFVWDDRRLTDLFEQHRRTGSECKVRFAELVNLVAEAIIQHQGSGRKTFEQAQEEGRLNATVEAVYGKLRRCPIELSEAFLTETTRYLQQLLPRTKGSQAIPPSLAGHRVWIVDGKKLKKLPKRLGALRGVSGKVLGGKAVVGMLLNDGMAFAMHASPDGEANDAPLTPGLIERLGPLQEGPSLIVADRQFCDLKIPHCVLAQGCDFVVRYSKRTQFFPEKERVFCDAAGRTVRDATGMLGAESNRRRMRVRMITLERPEDEDVTLITNLENDESYPAEDLLQVYLERWGIERMFQTITEVFHLTSLIGTSPQGAIFQFALCTCLYNVIHVLRSYVAVENDREPRDLSMEMIFNDVTRQFTALTVFTQRGAVGTLPIATGSAAEVRALLHTIMAGQWSNLWQKCPTRRHKPPSIRVRVRGGHSSAFKLIQAAKARAKANKAATKTYS